MNEGGFRSLLENHVEGAALDRMVRYAELLERWSQRHNLVRFSDRRELVERHLLDALAGAPLLEGSGRLLDVGSGAGLPGVPLLAVSPGWRGVLLEPRHKRWAFLKMAIRELDLSAEAEASRYEDLGGDARFDLITCRAVGNHEGLLAWARERLVDGGGVALWTTEDDERRVSRVAGWRVLSWPLVRLQRGRLVLLRAEGPSST
ncbi:MAG: 16S rRNA (guanine(527)-N(7))-methyltransferase RsmG [Thermoanaerobaculales bacterium]|jgi:16S rRNA (guanine527-N7)-methyltransferase|nr:16S rRNA (guanine(527)-N(7))-methyltransferase RsmG [Thermoanaerobaculales bacterium]